MADVAQVDVNQLEQNPQARWTIVETPQALPGECLLCRGEASNREWFVDTGISWDYYGAIYICSECITEITHIVGFITPIEKNELLGQIGQLQQGNYALKVESAALNDIERAVNVFNESRANNPPMSSGALSPVQMGGADQAPDGQVDGRAEGGPSPGEISMGVGEGETLESGDDEELGELHSDAGSNGDEFTLNI